MSIRKISFENNDLQGAGILWFKNLNEADPYLILPILSSVLNYFNLTVSIFISTLIFKYREALTRITNIGL